MTNLDQSLIGLSTFLDQRVANRQKELEYYRNKFDEEKRKRLVMQSFLNTPIGKEMNSQGIINEATPFEAINLALNAFGISKEDQRYKDQQDRLDREELRKTMNDTIENAKYKDELNLKTRELDLREKQLKNSIYQQGFDNKIQDRQTKVAEDKLILEKELYDTGKKGKNNDLFIDADKAEINKWENQKYIHPGIEQFKSTIKEGFNWGNEDWADRLQTEAAKYGLNDLEKLSSAQDFLKLKTIIDQIPEDELGDKGLLFKNQLHTMDSYELALFRQSEAIKRQSNNSATNQQNQGWDYSSLKK